MAREQRRSWAGSTMDERRAQRREQLIRAGRELLGTGEAVSVRAVCRAAKLTERYFYESFDDRDALVIAAYEQVSQEAVAAVAEAVAGADGSPESVARAAVRVAVEHVVDDPARGHVLVVAPLTNPVLFEKREELVPILTALIREQLPGKTSESERDMVALGISGALIQIFYSYLTGRLVVEREAFVEHCVRLLLSAGAMWPTGQR